MSLDVSDAIALAKDLLKTSGEFRTHDRELAEQFAGRAFEICDDLGIDRNLIDDGTAHIVDEPADEDGTASAVVEMTSAEVIDEETQESNRQLRDLLQQQARVLQNVRETDDREAPKAQSRSPFRLFGRADDRPFAGLQSASA